MKKLIIAMIAIAISACGGESSEDSVELAAVEICLDQGGEWQGECAFSGEYCIARAQCKPNAEFCPCVQWTIKD